MNHIEKTTNETSHEDLENPRMLAKKAKREIMENGTTSIKCPKCDKYPTLSYTPRKERTILSCECRYVHDVDINL